MAFDVDRLREPLVRDLKVAHRRPGRRGLLLRDDDIVRHGPHLHRIMGIAAEFALDVIDHVGLAAAEPHLADDNVVDCFRGIPVTGDEKPAHRARGEDRQLTRPFPIGARRGHETRPGRGPALGVEADRDRGARLGPAPDRDRLPGLEHGMVADDGRQANVGPGRLQGEQGGDEKQG